jgi:hypothetical protein
MLAIPGFFIWHPRDLYAGTAAAFTEKNPGLQRQDFAVLVWVDHVIAPASQLLQALAPSLEA